MSNFMRRVFKSMKKEPNIWHVNPEDAFFNRMCDSYEVEVADIKENIGAMREVIERQDDTICKLQGFIDAIYHSMEYPNGCIENKIKSYPYGCFCVDTGKDISGTTITSRYAFTVDKTIVKISLPRTYDLEEEDVEVLLKDTDGNGQLVVHVRCDDKIHKYIIRNDVAVLTLEDKYIAGVL